MVKNRMWMVRAGEGGYQFDVFKSENIVAIGWETGDLSNISTLEDIKKILKEKYPTYNAGRLNITAGQIHRFRSDFKEGDNVVTYDSGGRIYLIGEITSDYTYDTKISNYFHTRKVKWLGHVPRDKLSTASRNTLGAISTIFEVPDVTKEEIMKLLKGEETTKDEEHDNLLLTTEQGIFELETSENSEDDDELVAIDGVLYRVIERFPSKITDDYWLYAWRKKGRYHKPTVRSGKWLIFVNVKEVDEVWKKIKKATEEGKLGSDAKVSTAKPNPYSIDPNMSVICVYTYDWKDEKDVKRIREELRKLGITNKISYKTDEDSLNGKYVVTGHTRISKYYE